MPAAVPPRKDAIYDIVVVPGDGVGPEVTEAARRVLDATGVPVTWHEHHLGASGVAATGEWVPQSTIEAIRRHGIALKGPIATPQDGSASSPNVAIRTALGITTQVRRAHAFADTVAPAPDLDVFVIRETTEDLYAGVGFAHDSDAAARIRDVAAAQGKNLPKDAGISLKYLSTHAVRRTWSFACEFARARGHVGVVAVHKAAVMPHTDGLFRAVGEELAQRAGLDFRAIAVDTMVAQLVRHPGDFGVLVAPNMYGDIVADLAGALAGGVGVVAGANYGPEAAVFEAAHGAAFRHAGRGTADPIGLMLSGAMALEHLGAPGAADELRRAIARVISTGVAPAELAPGAGVSVGVFTDAVVGELQHGQREHA